jgi:chromosome partitioning protein
MKTVALIAQKGGSGKSTLVAHLAVCASRQKQSVAVIDLDPQGSVAAWGERRAGDDIAVVSARIQELAGLLANAKEQGADLVLIDTAGRADEVAAQVMEAVDLVLIPCRPFINDVEASQETVAQVQKARVRRAAFVLNAVPVQGSRQQEARDALESLLPVAPVELHHYVAYGDALNDGRSVEELDPKGKAAQEVRALYEWLILV